MGWRRLDQHLRPGTVRPALVARRQMARSPDRLILIYKDGNDAERARSGLWLPVVAQFKTRPMDRFAQGCLLGFGQRRQLCVHRSGSRSPRGMAMERPIE